MTRKTMAAGQGLSNGNRPASVPSRRWNRHAFKYAIQMVSGSQVGTRVVQTTYDRRPTAEIATLAIEARQGGAIC